MSGLVLEVQLDGNACVVLSGITAKLWIGAGLPVYEGNLEGMQKAHPEQFKVLLERGIIKPR
jgi:hypothetical protein